MEIVIGTYASQKPIERPFVRNNLYQASVDFEKLAEDYQVNLTISLMREQKCLWTDSKVLESRYDFSEQAVEKLMRQTAHS